MCYLVSEMLMLLEAQGGSLGTPDRDLCFVADVRLGERIGAPEDHAVRVRDIRGACQQIASLWAGIQAKPALWKKQTKSENQPPPFSKPANRPGNRPVPEIS